MKPEASQPVAGRLSPRARATPPGCRSPRLDPGSGSQHAVEDPNSYGFHGVRTCAARSSTWVTLSPEHMGNTFWCS
jgi:hypothetical protein